MLNKSAFHAKSASLCDTGAGKIKDLVPFGQPQKFQFWFNQCFPENHVKKAGLGA
jgi:hypothetical protein